MKRIRICLAYTNNDNKYNVAVRLPQRSNIWLRGFESACVAGAASWVGVSGDILHAIGTEAGTFAADAHVNGANLT